MNYQSSKAVNSFSGEKEGLKELDLDTGTSQGQTAGPKLYNWTSNFKTRREISLSSDQKLLEIYGDHVNLKVLGSYSNREGTSLFPCDAVVFLFGFAVIQTSRPRSLALWTPSGSGLPSG